MKAKHIVRAWKDQEYRQNLSTAERELLPAHPSGMIELTDADLGVASGGNDSKTLQCPTRPLVCNQTLPPLCKLTHPPCL